MKRILSLILLLAVIAGVCGCKKNKKGPPEKVFTDYLAFYLKSDGTYKVYAKEEAEMPEELEIPEKIEDTPVTEIGAMAFSGLENVTGVILPESIGRIDFGAFSDCAGITEITLPEGLKYIEGSAFSGCSGLTEINIPSGVICIGTYVFSNCENLKGITVSAGNTAYVSEGSCVIERATGELVAGCKDSVIPGDGSVISIGEGAFAHSGITEINVPDSVMVIGESAFYGCRSLESVALGAGVSEIRTAAFADCGGLNSLTVSENNEKYVSRDNCIYEKEDHLLVAGCKNSILPDPKADKEADPNKEPGFTVSGVGDYAFCGCTGLYEIDLPEGVTEIGAYAFKDCTGLTNISVPDTVTKIGAYAFEGCENLNYTEYDNVAYLGNEENPYLAVMKATYGTAQTFIIKDGAKIIYDKAFYQCEKLSGLTLPEGIIRIGECAFEGCSELAAIDLPDGVVSIGAWAFRDCTNLERISVPDSIADIGMHAFFGCSALRFNETDGSLYLGSPGDFYTVLFEVKDKSAVQYTTKDRTRVVYTGAFQSCRYLKTVTVSEGVRCIGERAFDGCEKLASVKIPDSAARIGSGVFRGCKSLVKITVGEDNAYYHVSDGCLIETDGRTLVAGTGDCVIPSDGSVVTVGEEAFCGRSDLKKINIPYGIENVRYSAFYGCENLKSLVLPGSIKRIDVNAFEGCTGLPFISFNGTGEQWESLTIKDYNISGARGFDVHFSDGGATDAEE